MDDYHDSIMTMMKSKREARASCDSVAENERFFRTVMKAEAPAPAPAPEPTPESTSEGGDVTAELSALIDEIEAEYGEEVADAVLTLLEECPELEDEVAEVRGAPAPDAPSPDAPVPDTPESAVKKHGGWDEGVGNPETDTAERPPAQPAQPAPPAQPGLRQRLVDRYQDRGQDIWNRWGDRLRSVGRKVRTGAQVGLGAAAAGMDRARAGIVAAGQAADEAGYKAGSAVNGLSKWYHDFRANRAKAKQQRLQSTVDQHTKASAAAGQAQAELDRTHAPAPRV